LCVASGAYQDSYYPVPENPNQYTREENYYIRQFKLKFPHVVWGKNTDRRTMLTDFNLEMQQCGGSVAGLFG
jgi:hypothetical protein